MASGLLMLTAIASVLFGALLLLIPEPLLSAFGITLDFNASLFARVLGGSWLGYAVVNWSARRADLAAQRAVILADLLTALTGLAASAYLALRGQASALAWAWVVMFAAFALWQVYVLAAPRRAA